MSLGGLTASLVASADDRLAFAIPNVPVVSLADLVLEWEPLASLVKLGLAASFKDIRLLREMLAPSCPLSFKPKLPRERMLIRWCRRSVGAAAARSAALGPLGAPAHALGPW